MADAKDQKPSHEQVLQGIIDFMATNGDQMPLGEQKEMLKKIEDYFRQLTPKEELFYYHQVALYLYEGGPLKDSEEKSEVLRNFTDKKKNLTDTINLMSEDIEGFVRKKSKDNPDAKKIFNLMGTSHALYKAVAEENRRIFVLKGLFFAVSTAFFCYTLSISAAILAPKIALVGAVSVLSTLPAAVKLLLGAFAEAPAVQWSQMVGEFFKYNQAHWIKIINTHDVFSAQYPNAYIPGGATISAASALQNLSNVLAGCASSVAVMYGIYKIAENVKAYWHTNEAEASMETLAKKSKKPTY